MQNTAFNSRAFRCPAFEPMFPLVGGVESAYAVGFDGTNDYIIVASADAVRTSSITVIGWFKITAVNSDIRTAVAHGTYETNKGWAINFNQSAGGSGAEGGHVRAWINTGSWKTVGAAIGSQIENSWIHVAFTFDNTTKAFTIYVNASPIGSSTLTGQSIAYGVADKLVIGAESNFTQYFNGLIDDVRIYNRALTAAEVQSIYRNSSSPPTDGLVAYFPMDEGTGTTTTDAIGGLTGTLTNGPTWEPQVCPRLKTGRDTTQSWGVSFDGTNDYIQVPDSNLLDATNGTSDVAITVSAWIKPTNVAADRQIVAKRKESVTNGCEWWMGYGSSYINFSLGDGSNSTNRIGRTSPALLPNVWSHVVGTYDGTGLASGVKIYVNGFRVDNANDVGGSYVRTRNSDAPVTIGCYSNSAVVSGICLGLIKDVRIYDSALVAADIAKLANNIPISATPVGHWKLDDGTSTTATDSSGNGNHGTLTNGPTWTGDIPQWFRPTIESSQALSCDGSNDYVSVASALISAAPCTLMCWFNSSSVAADQTLLSLGQSANETNYFALRAAGAVASDPIQAVASSLSEAAAASASGYTASAWHHAAGVFASTTSRTAYLNGVAGTANTTSKTPASLDATAIGRLTKQTPSEYAAASIDEACVYSRALTAAEIADAAAGYLVRAGLVSRWKLDGNAQDSAGSNHGTEQGGVGYSTNVPGTL